jgi:DNA-binding IclR family transcriptional regulator
VLRAVAVLEVFTAEDTELGLGLLAERSGNPRSSTHRLVTDLVTCGFLERGQYGYRLGAKLFEMGHLVPLHRRLREAALPFMQDLHEATHLTVNLAMRDANEIVYVEKLVQRGTRVPHTRSGGRLPMHCTGLGKAILAFSQKDDVEQILAEPLVALTPHTITNPSDLRSELADIRQTHVAFDNEESQVGLFCVASPVVGRQGLIAAISVTGARAAEHTQRLAPVVMTVARALSRYVGAPQAPAG